MSRVKLKTTGMKPVVSGGSVASERRGSRVKLKTTGLKPVVCSLTVATSFA